MQYVHKAVNNDFYWFINIIQLKTLADFKSIVLKISFKEICLSEVTSFHLTLVIS